jgi:hypothetical protein
MELGAVFDVAGAQGEVRGDGAPEAGRYRRPGSSRCFESQFMELPAGEVVDGLVSDALREADWL